MAKTRETYTAEYKLQAVRMVTDQHLAVAEVARRLGITEGRLHDWLQAFRAREIVFCESETREGFPDELHPRRRASDRVRAHRVVLQPGPAALVPGVPLPS